MKEDSIFLKIAELKKEKKKFALVVVTKTLGSTPRKEGAKMLVQIDGKTYGTIGGGEVELAVTNDAIAIMKNGKAPKLIEYALNKLGMCCGGKMTCYIEPQRNMEKMIIFGGGHIGRPVAMLADMLGFNVTVIDSNPKLVDRDKFPDEVEIITKPYNDVIKKLEFDLNSYIVIATRNFEDDLKILTKCIEKKYKYLGMIGSKSKMATFRNRWKKSGRNMKFINKVHTPMGIEISSETPEEIAISTIAEIVAIRNK